MIIKDFVSFNPKGRKPTDYVNYIDTSSVEDGKLIDIQCLSENIPSRAQRVIEKGDILISSVRPILKHNYYVSQHIENGIASTGFIQIRADRSKVIPQYLYYFLTEENKVKMYQTIAETSQSTFPSFNKDVIENMTFPDVSLAEQQHIVDILGTLDDKIENLEQKIQILLKICELDYKVLISGKSCNACLSDIASVESGKRPITKESILSNTINIPIIGASDVMGYTDNVLFDEPILVIGRVGTHGIVQPIFKRCWASDNTLVIKSEYYAYAYNILKNIDYSSINKGSTQPLITQTDIRNTPVYVPDLNELLAFENKHSMFLIQTYKDQIEKTKDIKNIFLQKFFG